MDVKKKNPNFRNFSMGLALAMSALLTACGGGGGGDSSTPAPANDAAAAAPAPAATENAAASTAGSNSQANNAPAENSATSAIYEQLRTQCPMMPNGTDEGGYYACAAHVYVGTSPKDSSKCKVNLTRTGNVSYAAGGRSGSFRLERNLFYFRSGPDSGGSPYFWSMKISGDNNPSRSADEYRFEMELSPKLDTTRPDYVSKPDHIDIAITRRSDGKLLGPETTTCRVPV